MKKYEWTFCFLALAGFLPAAVSAPVLKWQRGGCYASWCETGWYSSPAVADLDGDGTKEVIAAAYRIWALNGEDGTVQWTIDPDGDRVWPGVAVADLDGNGSLEVITAHGQGYLHVFHPDGTVWWSRRPVTNELRGLSISDLDADGTLEIIVTAAVGSQTNTWVYEHNGTVRTGWPQLAGGSGFAFGVFNANASAGDLDGDGQGELVVPSDVHYICAYRPDGTQLDAHAMYGSKKWGAVGIWESLATELKGWGDCETNRAERYRTNFAHGPASLGDVDGDGTIEVAATGNVYDCQAGHPPGKYTGVYLFNKDRSRFAGSGHNWESPPVDTGAPLSEDYTEIENCQTNPALADLDGDGRLEILFPSYDGKLHAFWLDKTEHHSWPYSVYSAAEGTKRFASEPVVADLDRDGHAEVVFTSWPEKDQNKTGKLHILSYQGTLLQEATLPAGFNYTSWNGALPAPTLANIDTDADLEIVVNTAHSGVVAYDLPGSAGAFIWWGTGRGNFQRSGLYVRSGDLDLDQRTDATDLAIFQNYLGLHLDPGMVPFRAPLAAGDLTGDGQARAADLKRLARRLAGN